MKPAGKFLIIRLSSLGDILHTMPAFQSLRLSFPEARIDWLVEKRMAFLLSAIKGIDGIITVDTAALRENPWSTGTWQGMCNSIGRLRAGRYDAVLDFQGLLKTALLALLSGAGTRIGFSRELIRERPAHWFYHRTTTGMKKPAHVVSLNQLLAGLAGAEISSDRIQLSAGPEDEASVASRIAAAGVKDFVVINPGGGWPTKRWPPARYGALAERLGNELGMDVVVTIGPGEERMFAEISRTCSAPWVHHFPVTFLQLIPLAKRARLFIGGDTGPFHLACALGTPAVGILGPTDPTRNGPWSPMDEVVVRVLPCSFCYGRTCPTQNECMDISVEQVFQAAVRRLEGTR